MVQDGPVPPPLEAAIDAGRRSVVPVELVVPVNRGLGVALTEGMARCAHDVVARMDADDISLPTRFAVQVPIVEGGVDCVGSGMLEIGTGRDDVVGTRVPPLSEERIVASSRMAQPFNHPTVVYRRRAVEAAGGYSDFKQMEDYLLFARMIQGGARVDVPSRCCATAWGRGPTPAGAAGRCCAPSWRCSGASCGWVSPRPRSASRAGARGLPDRPRGHPAGRLPRGARAAR
nr:glycosyltransferase [Arsenicicoccus dermatophilus]